MKGFAMNTKLVIWPLLFLLLAAPLFPQTPAQERARERVVDNAGLLSSAERDSLSARIDAIADEYSFDLVIVTQNSISGGDAMIYADNFFDDNGYGLGGGRDGSLFLLVTETRDYGIARSGRGVGVLNSYAFNKLESGAVSYLRGDNYYAAFSSFLDNWERFLIMDSKGRSYNFFIRWNALLVIIGWLIAFTVGFIVVFVWKKGMNTALPKTQAASYVVSGSLAFDAKTDSLLYSDVKKIKRESQSTASSLSKSLTSLSGGKQSGRSGRY